MRLHLGTLILAWLLAMALWGMAHGTSSIDRGVDIPVVFDKIPSDLVLTSQSASAINVRVLGSRAALRNVSPTKLDYPIDVSGAKNGLAVYEVDVSRIDLPRGATIVSRSPASIEVRFERRGRKAVRVRPDISGQPPAGYALGPVTVEPARVWLTGARGEVLRLTEVVTETIDVSNLTAPEERKVKLASSGDHVWMEDPKPVTVKIDVEALPSDAQRGDAGSGAGGQAGARAAGSGA